MKAIINFLKPLLGLAGTLSFVDIFLDHFPQYKQCEFWFYAIAWVVTFISFIITICHFEKDLEKENAISPKFKNFIKLFGILVTSVVLTLWLYQQEKDSEIEAPLYCIIPLNEIPAEAKKGDTITVRFLIKNHDNFINKTTKTCKIHINDV